MKNRVIDDNVIRPAPVHIPQHELDDLRTRLERTRWSDVPVGAGSDYGVPPEYVWRQS